MPFLGLYQNIIMFIEVEFEEAIIVVEWYEFFIGFTRFVFVNFLIILIHLNCLYCKNLR